MPADQATEPFLFPVEAIPEVAIPVSEHSIEAREGAMLRLAEAVRFDPDRLAAYERDLQAADVGHPVRAGRDFLDFVIAQLGGRSQ